MTDIVNLSNAEDEIDHGFRQSLAAYGAAYEIHHPKVSFAVPQVLDMLAKMGI